MQLKSLTYSEHEGTNQEWRLEGLELRDRNLIVGRNAAGKTRTLNVIHGLARQVSGQTEPATSGHTTAVFSDADRSLTYELHNENEQVVLERLTIDGETLLDRGPGGEGKIYAEELEGGSAMMRFQTPPNQIAAVARRDTIQHKFLEVLHRWGSAVRMYGFGTPLGKDHYSVFAVKGAPPPDERNPNQVVALFRKANKTFGDAFDRAVMDDMAIAGYDIERIGVAPLVSARIVAPAAPPGEVVALFVKEKRLPGVTDQLSMSQGMFRALSLFVHVNYCIFAKSATCLLVDDIGEGLDFERSCKIIDNLRTKTDKAPLQLILTTNDRFVMNSVPLEEWSVLQRTGGSIRVRNYQNSRSIFEEFKFTGLSNFSFFEMDVINDPKAGENPSDA